MSKSKATQSLLTFHGPGHFLEVPGFFTIAAGESHPLDSHVAEAVYAANPELNLTIEDLPATNAAGDSDNESQPEAHKGEGQPIATDLQKE